MLNILDVHPKEGGIPTEPLRQAAAKLKEVAEEAQTIIQQDHRFTHLSKTLPPEKFAQARLTRFKEAIKSKIDSQYGKLKGPSQNALEQLDRLAARALKAGYRLESAKVEDAFFAFLFAYVTSGFQNLDTTGTQMGNYKGEWGGFFKYD